LLIEWYNKNYMAYSSIEGGRPEVNYEGAADRIADAAWMELLQKGIFFPRPKEAEVPVTPPAPPAPEPPSSGFKK
jgi:hypothetical protein